MHDNRHACSPVMITTALYGTCMAHIFIRVCALIYNSVSPSTFARHLGHQYLSQMGEESHVSSHLSIDAVATKQRRAARPRPPGPRGVQTEQAR